MEKNPAIPVGKGKVILDNSLKEYAGKGYYIVIRIESTQGPCNDVDCQKILNPVVEISQLPDDSYKVFAGDGFFVAMEPPILNYIDKDRQEVTIKKTKLGKLVAKGLVF